MSNFNQRRDRRIEDFRQLEDQRTLNDGYTDNRKDMYNAMLNLILKHKVELQKIPATSALESATNWARKRGLRAGQQDLDGDGKPETVVYNKAGKPWIINGYRLKASDYPTRHAFYTAFPTAEDRAGENMKQWIQDQAYDIRVDPDNPWRKTVRNTQFGDNLKEWGYRMPTKPKRKQSVFNIFCKLIAPILKEYYESEEGYPITLLGDEADANSVKLLKKIISPIAMYRILYMKMVEREYFFHTLQQPEYHNMNYTQFKKYVKNYENKFYTWFKLNYLDQLQTNFKPNKITPLIIQGQLVKDSIQWDGSDPDDAIVFMIGINNWEHECGENLRNRASAAEFLEALADKKHPNYKQSTKLLTRWKKIASNSQRKFFKDQIQYLFENEGALDRFNAAVAHGINTLANTTEQAAQESADNPSSPLRQPTRQQEQQTEEERNETTYAAPPPEVHITPEMEQQMRQLDAEANEAPLPPDDDDDDFTA